MIYIYLLAGGALAASFVKDRKKTKKALITAWKMFIKMLPMLLGIVAVVSLLLFLLPSDVIVEYLGSDNSIVGITFALLIGSISLLPGFIAFPLSGLLLNQGVSYTVLAAFTTTLMMVGLITLPMERRYFGTKLSILRNLSGFVIAILVSLGIGLLYGEIL